MRERWFGMLAGSPGAGKSTYSANLVKGYGENAIVYKHKANIDDKAFSFLNEKTTGSWRQGATAGASVKCKIAGTQDEYIEFLRWVKTSYRNGLLIIDDATIFERDRLTKEMNELVTMRRHYGIDLLLVYHGLTLLPIEQFIFCNWVVLFNTNDNLKYKANKLPFYDQFMAAVNEARRNFQSADKRLKYTPSIVKIS